MMVPFILKRLALLSALTPLILSGSGVIYPAIAQEAPTPAASQASLLDLGAEFMRSMRNNLRQSDLYLSGAGKFELAEQRSGSFYPDDEPLLLHPVIGRNGISGRQDIYTVKNNHRAMISLADFFLATELPIKVNVSNGTATGWFIRQTNTFNLDMNAKQVSIAGKIQSIDLRNVHKTDNDILVSAETLESWLGLGLDYDLSGLNLLITTPDPFPIELAYVRSQRSPRNTDSAAGAKLPPLEPEYGYVSIPYMDTELGMNVFQSPGSRRTHNENWSTILSGDYGGFNTSAYLSGTSIKPFLDSARITMGKEDPRANLLGPLHATSYQFGDVNSVSNSIIGNSQQERGFTVTNRSVNRETTKTYTEIRGDSHPDWDIELYRNEAYLDIRHVGPDGKYDFGKVDLNVGLNDFKLVFYSPQGERTEEHQTVNVDSSVTLGGGDGRYAVSVTQNGKNVYSRQPQTGTGVGAPHFAGTYEYGIAGLGTLTSGISSDNDNGTRRTFFETGLATALYDTVYNATLAYDTSNASYGSILTARRNFGLQSGRLEYNHNSEGFNPGSANAGAGFKDSYSASLGGPLLRELFFLNNLTYNTGTSFAKDYNGNSTWQSGASFTTRIQSIVFNAGVQYTTSSSPSNPDDGTVGSTNDSFSSNYGLRGRMFGGGWRLGATYEILPKKQLTRADAEYTRSLADNIDSTTSLSYDPLSETKTISVGLNWITPKAVISPRIEYDNRHNVAASVSAHFGLAVDPHLSDVYMTNSYVTSSGGVVAKIFQDNNGNGMFDDGDKPLEDATIVAIQGQQSANSDKNGVAFIPALSKNILTDITVNAGGSEAAYGVSLFKGRAILPHPGAVTELAFPIVNSGELDGQANATDEKGGNTPARGLGLSLITPDGRLHKTANVESDGYWSMSSIEPGIYYLTASTDETNQGYFLPRILEYKPDGTTLFGQDVKLTRGYTTNFRFTAENSPPDGANHARVIRPSDIASQRIELEVGSFHSRLAMTLAWYKIKLTNKVPGGLILAMPMAGMPVEESTGLSSLILRPNTIASIEQGASACQSLGEMHLGSCSVNVITTYRALQDEKIKPYKTPPVEVAAKPEEIPAEKTTFAAKPEAAVAPVTMAAGDSTSAAQSENPVINTADDTKPATTATLSPALAADLADYVAVNPALNKALLKDKTVLLNLGSYNSRALMTVIWFKIRTRYAGLIGDAQLLVQPTDSNASPQTGKYTLRASLPVFNVEDANNRCRLLMAQAQVCTVEVLPSGLQASR